MELALLVYAISLLEPIKTMATILCMLPIAGIFASGMFTNDGLYFLRPLWVKLVIIPLFILAVLTCIFLPKEKTAYLMIGAYTAQKVYDNPTTERLSNKVIQTIEGKLDFYVEEAEKEAAKKIRNLNKD